MAIDKSGVYVPQAYPRMLYRKQDDGSIAYQKVADAASHKAMTAAGWVGSRAAASQPPAQPETAQPEGIAKGAPKADGKPSKPAR